MSAVTLVLEANSQLPELQKRVTGTQTSSVNAKAEEERRVAAAKRQIEADRQLVKDRVERERIAREAREAARARAESEPQPQEEPQFHVRGPGRKLDASAPSEGVASPQASTRVSREAEDVGPEDDADMIPSDQEDDQEEGDEDEGEETDEEEREFRRQDIENRMGMFGMASNAHHWGGGQKLGD